MRLTPATRAVVLAAGFTLALTSPAASAEETTTVVVTETETAAAPAPAEPFMATIYFGESLGYAYQEKTDNFAWTLQVLARPIQYFGMQIEYLNMGNDHAGRGDYDGFYFGLAPMYPVLDRLDLYAQVGIAVADQGDDVVGGAGAMYRIPFEWLEKNNVDLTARLDYKYLNWAAGDHLVTLGIMFGLHK